MGYLDGSTVTVDAILTKHGRKLLAQGQGLGITKFALSDDGIDYDLWNPDHPSGSANYGTAIENLPQLEPTPDDSTVMRYKLTTLNRNTKYLPLLVLPIGNDILIEGQGTEYGHKIAPETANHTAENYKFFFENTADITVVGGTFSDQGGAVGAAPASVLEMNQPGEWTAKEITILAKPTPVKRTVLCRITGVTSGVYGEVQITLRNNIRTLQIGK